MTTIQKFTYALPFDTSNCSNSIISLLEYLQIYRRRLISLLLATKCKRLEVLVWLRKCKTLDVLNFDNWFSRNTITLIVLSIKNPFILLNHIDININWQDDASSCIGEVPNQKEENEQRTENVWRKKAKHL